jgi:hypothetical protein
MPRQGNRADALDLQPGRWAMDNGAFGGGFDPGSFVDMLQDFYGFPGCLFVTAPDVIYKSGIGNAAETRKRWPFWSRLIRGLGFPPAFVAQDGLQLHQVPWDEMGALFIGGSTEYKEGRDAQNLCSYAKAIGIWVHWGRVNGRTRYTKAKERGADSIDGTGFSIAPDINIPLVAEWERDRVAQPGLAL